MLVDFFLKRRVRDVFYTEKWLMVLEIFVSAPRLLCRLNRQQVNASRLFFVLVPRVVGRVWVFKWYMEACVEGRI